MNGCPSGCSCNWNKPAVNERMVEMVRLLHHSVDYIDQTPGRSGINGQQHALRCGGLGFYNSYFQDAAFIGVVHDLARPLNDVHHGEIMAEMVRDRVNDDTYHILRTHGQYQASIVHGTPPPKEPWSRMALEIADYELQSFSALYDGPTLSFDAAVNLMEQYLGDK